VAPPNTSVPAALADIPVVPVVFDYFGPWSVVDEILFPVRVLAAGPVGEWSAPNATDEDNSYAELFTVSPPGAEFITFFTRGSRIYVLDTATQNYCWIDNDIARP
jgi:hypothetical protein